MTIRLTSLVSLVLAGLLTTAHPAIACRLHSGVDAAGRWVVDDGQRKIAYRLTGISQSGFELRIEKTPPQADARITCRSSPCTPLRLVLALTGVKHISHEELTPGAIRQHFEQFKQKKAAEASSRLKIRAFSDPKEISLGAFKSLLVTASLDLPAGPRGDIILMLGHLSDGCAAIRIVGLYPDFKHKTAPSIPAEELARVLADMLQSVVVTRVDP